MPIEGYRLAFNGTKGRMEVRDFERQAWDPGEEREMYVIRNVGKRAPVTIADLVRLTSREIAASQWRVLSRKRSTFFFPNGKLLPFSCSWRDLRQPTPPKVSWPTPTSA